MGLRLVTGPANAGKTGLAIDAFIAALDRGERPWLVAPTGTDAARLEREITRSRGGVVGAVFGTLDSVAREVLSRVDSLPRRWTGPIEKRVVLTALARSADLSALAASRSTPGFADALVALADGLGEVEWGDPGAGPVGDPTAAARKCGAGAVAEEALAICHAYRTYLGQTDALDSVGAVSRAASALASAAPDRAWSGDPLVLLGFDDFSPAELRLVEGLAAATDVMLSLTWVEGRAVFDGIAHVAEALRAIAGEHWVVRAEPGRYRNAVLFDLERHLFGDASAVFDPTPETFGSCVAAGPRAEVELVASEIMSLAARGVPAEEICVAARSLEPYRSLVRHVFDSAGIPYDIEVAGPLAGVPLGRALLALARFTVAGEREELFRLVLSPYGGIPAEEGASFEARARSYGVVDGRKAARFLLRGLGESAVSGGEPAVVRWLSSRAGRDPHALLRLVEDAAPTMLVNAHGRVARRLVDEVAADAATAAAALEAVAEIRRLLARGERFEAVDVLAALERVEVLWGREGRPGRVQVLPVLRARGRRFHTVIILGLNEGRFPLTPGDDPFFSPAAADALARAGLRVPEPPGVAWERYLFYTLVTRARSRLVLSHQAADADGSPLTRSFFVDDLEALFGGTAPGSVRKKGLSSPVFDEPGLAPGAREHRRALAAAFAKSAGFPDEGAAGPPEWLADALRRAVGPPPALRGAAADALAERREFSATQLEVFGQCPLRWFIQHELAPRELDRRLGPRERGSLVHRVLEALGSDIADPRFGRDEAFTAEARRRARRHLDDEIARLAGGLEGVEVELARRQAAGQLEAFLARQRARHGRFRPGLFELRFDDEPVELADGIAVRGRIDRVDVAEDGSAFLIDYKTGRTAPDARSLLKDAHLQLRLYCLVWDTSLGKVAAAGSGEGSRSVGAALWALGADTLRGVFDGSTAEADELGLQAAWSLDPDAWAEALDRARTRAVEIAHDIKRGVISPDHGGARGARAACWFCDLGGWCELWN